MKQVIAAAVLAVASGTTMAGAISGGNVDLHGWVVENQPKASAAVVEADGISRHNVDLYGWVVDNHSVKATVSTKPSRASIGRVNVDLHEWVVADIMAK